MPGLHYLKHKRYEEVTRERELRLEEKLKSKENVKEHERDLKRLDVNYLEESPFIDEDANMLVTAGRLGMDGLLHGLMGPTTGLFRTFSM